MRKDIDAIEDKKDFFEKEYESTKSMLSEAVDEKSRLTGVSKQIPVSIKSTIFYANDFFVKSIYNS